VTGVATGAAYISYTVTNGVCNKYATKYITVAASRSSFDDIPADGVLRVFPNPTAGMLTVESEAEGVFAVYTMEGKELVKYTVNKGATMISLPAGLAAGLYMCRFSGSDGSGAVVRLVYEQKQ
jgi:hypothetical protein